ncbi:MFS transporter [Enterococcus raffinosus]|jgi:PPP family 3-phenylpropionic acid transporter|uniref:MFS transporter n=1 Tax=Enterococcus raffinosus TaxID=71452 RepID=UPI001C477255|nr:MFS transporter [Enterococcus raffinosus]MDT2570358.1 MFS transporter [Enterococcus raffinosus]QXJ59735.1 MFS transporter [Enterococcus raffinosus]
MEKTHQVKLNLQYISMQVPYWMGYSVLSTFTSVFLLSRDFTNSQIGLVLSLANLFAAIVQPFLASFADRMIRIRLSQLAAGMALLLVLFSGILLVVPKVFLIVALIYILLYACLVLLQPLTIAIGTFFISRGYNLNFGVARGLGSLAFAAASAVTGVLIERFSSTVILYLLIGFFLFFALMTLLIDTRRHGGTYSESLIPEHHEEDHLEEPIGLLEFIKKYKRFIVLLAGVSLLFVFHTITNSYMFQILHPLGGTEANVGSSLSVAALSELPTMFFFSWLLRRFKIHSLMRVAAFFFSVKALLILFAGSIFLINVAQSLQMVGFAMHTMASVYYTNQIIPQKDLVKGQTLMATANTMGGIIGAFVGGQMLSFLSVSAMLLIGTMISIAGTLIVWLAVEK